MVHSMFADPLILALRASQCLAIVIANNIRHCGSFFGVPANAAK